jgi:outer membrane protein TolC
MGEDISFASDSIDSNNPKLVELDKRISAAEAQELLAIKQGMPRLGLGFEYFVTAKRPNIVMEDNGKDAWMPMLTVSLPIYRSKYRASVSEAKHMQQSYTELRKEVNNQLNSAFEMAVFERSKARQEMELFDKQIKQTHQIVDLLVTSYSNSVTDFEEILMMQQTLLKYEMNKITAAKEYFDAEAQLKFLIAR